MPQPGPPAPLRSRLHAALWPILGVSRLIQRKQNPGCVGGAGTVWHGPNADVLPRSGMGIGASSSTTGAPPMAPVTRTFGRWRLWPCFIRTGGRGRSASSRGRSTMRTAAYLHRNASGSSGPMYRALAASRNCCRM